MRIEYNFSNDAEQDGLELAPSSASCALYASCASTRRDETNCQRDIHPIIQAFCDGPVLNYRENGGLEQKT